MPVADTGPAGFGVHYATPRSHRWQPRSAAVSAARAAPRPQRPDWPALSPPAAGHTGCDLHC